MRFILFVFLLTCFNSVTANAYIKESREIETGTRTTELQEKDKELDEAKQKIEALEKRLAIIEELFKK
jgi:hypothetical protein